MDRKIKYLAILEDFLKVSTLNSLLITETWLTLIICGRNKIEETNKKERKEV